MNINDVYSYRLRYFLAACCEEIVVCLPLAARKPKLFSPCRLSALTVQRAQLQLNALPRAVTIHFPVILYAQ